MTKVDLKKELDSYRAGRGEFRILEVPDLSYLKTDGHGDPNLSPPRSPPPWRHCTPSLTDSSSPAGTHWTATTS
ncbi:hypothetical protein GCM10027408_29970 [Microbacterium tumbae]